MYELYDAQKYANILKLPVVEMVSICWGQKINMNLTSQMEFEQLKQKPVF